MSHLSSLLRLCPHPSLYLRIRGPKKKGAVQAKIQSNDIINIFKQRKDPQPKDIAQYPLFVQQMSLGDYSIHQLGYATALNIKFMMPTKPLYKSYLRAVKRQRFKTLRQYKQLDLLPISKDKQRDKQSRNQSIDIFAKAKQQEQAKLAAQEAARAEEESDDQD